MKLATQLDLLSCLLVGLFVYGTARRIGNWAPLDKLDMMQLAIE
jgi:hypothetical protein